MRYPDEHLDGHLDEGTIHAWLDEALTPDESRVIEAHVHACERCSAAVAEARGLMAASSRILSALDEVPAGVVPDAGSGAASDQLAALRARRAATQSARRRSWWRNPQLVAAASVAFVALGTAAVVWRGSFRADAPGEAPVARSEADRAASTDTLRLRALIPAPERRVQSVAASRPPVPAEARPEGKVAAAPDSMANANVADAARAREDRARLSDVAPTATGAGQRAAESPPASPPARLERQAGATVPVQQNVQQLRPQAPQQLPVQDELLTATRRAEAKASAPPAPAAAAPSRVDSIGSASAFRSAESNRLMLLADAGCYDFIGFAAGDPLAAALPTGVRLDTTRVRGAGDTVWYRAVPLPTAAAREVEWRRIDGGTVELAWTAAAPGARLVGRVRLESPAVKALGLSAATEASARRADAPAVGVRAVRVGCPR